MIWYVRHNPDLLNASTNAFTAPTTRLLKPPFSLDMPERIRTLPTFRHYPLARCPCWVALATSLLSKCKSRQEASVGEQLRPLAVTSRSFVEKYIERSKISNGKKQILVDPGADCESTYKLALLP